jgi:hypothetical protein
MNTVYTVVYAAIAVLAGCTLAPIAADVMYAMYEKLTGGNQ